MDVLLLAFGCIGLALLFRLADGICQAAVARELKRRYREAG